MADKSKDIEKIFNVALNINSEEKRNAYLDKACGDDHVIRSRIETLIRSHDEAGDFLETPVIDPDVTLNNSNELIAV